MTGLIAFVSVVLMIFKALNDIVESGDFFEIHRQLQREVLKRQEDTTQLKFQTTLLDMKLKAFKQRMENDFCHRRLKEKSTGYCCMDWTDLKAGCFRIGLEPMNWFEADILCREIGHIATIDSFNRFRYLNSILDNFGNRVITYVKKNLMGYNVTETSFWIGIYSPGYQNEYRWIETNQGLEYENYNLDYIRNVFVVVKGCITVFYENKTKAYKWLDTYCNHHAGTICQIDFSRPRKYIPISFCPYGWTEIQKSCFLFSKLNSNEKWNYGQIMSNRYGHLAVVDNAELHERLVPLLRKRVDDYHQLSHWIGLEYYNNSYWGWINTQKAVEYTNWAEGEPKPGDICASYKKEIDGFKWFGYHNCYFEYRYPVVDVNAKPYITEKEIYNWYHFWRLNINSNYLNVSGSSETLY